MSNHPTWDKVINHVASNSAQGTALQAGAIKAWLSSLILRPNNKLETMVLYGSEASGKSTFIRAVELIPVETRLVTCDGGMQFCPAGSHAIVAQQDEPKGDVFALPVNTIEYKDRIILGVIEDNLQDEMPAFMRTLLDIE